MTMHTNDVWPDERNRSEIPNSSEQSEPDWDSAPEGATHVYMHDIHGASWRRKGGFDSWYYWDADKWVFMREGSFMSDEYIERPRPKQSKSTEPEVRADDNGNNDSRVQAWNAVFNLLTHLDPKLTERGATGREMVVNSIKAAFSEPQEQEWNGWNDFSESEPTEWLSSYMVSITTPDENQFVDVRVFDQGKWWKTSQMPEPFNVTHWRELPEPPKIQSDAERKREDTISEWAELVAEAVGSNFTMTEAYGVIYEWLSDNNMLKDGEL